MHYSRCNASRGTELKHVVSHSSTNMLTEAQNGLPAGEVSWFERHALNIPAASQPQRPPNRSARNRSARIARNRQRDRILSSGTRLPHAGVCI